MTLFEALGNTIKDFKKEQNIIYKAVSYFRHLL